MRLSKNGLAILSLLLAPIVGCGDDTQTIPPQTNTDQPPVAAPKTGPTSTPKGTAAPKTDLQKAPFND